MRERNDRAARARLPTFLPIHLGRTLKEGERQETARESSANEGGKAGTFGPSVREGRGQPRFWRKPFVAARRVREWVAKMEDPGNGALGGAETNEF